MNLAPSAHQLGNPILGVLAYPVTDEEEVASLKKGFKGCLAGALGKD
jgi:hypothetical protein